MTQESSPERTGPVGGPAGLDGIALDLQALREAAGAPSYAEIASRIARQRQARGLTPAAARIGRTTVYDCFRTGRRRLAPELVVEVVRALGADESEAESWAARCREANRRPAPEPAPPVAEPEPEPPVPAPVRPARRTVGLLLLACLVLNLLGREVVGLLALPLHLDMTGTAVAAVCLGPWWGAAVGLATNLTGVGISGWVSLPFAAVNVAGALVWGYGARLRWVADSVSRFFAVSLVAGLVCSAIAAPIVVLLLGGDGQNGTDEVASRILRLSGSPVFSEFSANVVTSLFDKVISGALALVALDAWRRREVSGRQPRP